MRSRAVRDLVLIFLGGIAILLLYVLHSWTVAGVDSRIPLPASNEATTASEGRESALTEAQEMVTAQGSPTAGAPAKGAQVAADSRPAGPEEQGPTSGMRIRGRVVDERTDEPIPALIVSLVCGNRSERVSTGAEGAFETLRAFPCGKLVVELIDLDSRIEQFERDFDPALASDLGILRARIGPTIPLLVEPGDAVACTARLVETARPNGIAGVILVRSTSLEARARLEGIGDRDWPWLQVRPGTPPWLRYPTALWNPDDRRTPRVEVRMCGTASEGRAAVPSTVGIQPRTRIRASADYGEVSGSLLWSTDMFQDGNQTSVHTFNPGASVLLLPKSTNGTEGETPIWHEIRVDSKGAFSFDRVRPGPWRLLAHATDHKVVLQDLEVFPGSMRLLPIQMIRTEKEAFFDVQFPETTSEWRQGRILVRLRLVAAGSFARGWLDPAFSGSFFDFPAAEFDMTEIAMECSPAFRPFVARVSTPPGDLDPRGVEASDESEFGFDVRDARTDQRINDFQVAFGPQGSIFGRPERSPKGGWRIARDAPLSWSIWSEGYAPAFGDQDSFHENERGRIARSDLIPGWGVSLLFRAGDPASFQADPWPWEVWTFPGATVVIGALACPPLRDVRVDVGPAAVATSDEEGEARLQLRDVPSQLTLRCGGWKLVGVEPSQGSTVPQYIVWMNRD
jgi:hypothetical protein